MERKIKYNINKIRFGFIPGMVLPLVIFMLMFLVNGNEVSFTEYLSGLWKLDMLIKMLSLCVTPNLLVFLYFFRRKWDMAARGVLMATFVYAFAVLITKAF
ncbi:hypothetical protein [Gaoshiqia sp. Z1-71]|uniref:hypothetical protein n=1 Tax=Gaoshiqia hydrogeniformans TaxID=3290090 RepID=UPI003BF8B897